MGFAINLADDGTPADEALLKQITAGDRAAFALLVNRHSRKFYAAAYKVLLHAEDAEEVVQEAFLKLWTGKAQWKEGKGAKFTTWFYRIVVNQAVDVATSAVRKRSAAMPEEMVDEHYIGAEKQLLRLEEGARVQEALAELPERQRAAIMMFYGEGMSQKEVAEILDITPKAVESLVGRAKLTLKERMKDYVAG